MVKLQTGMIVRVEYEGTIDARVRRLWLFILRVTARVCVFSANWLPAKVMEVDGSLVNMLFMLDGRTEWIYRGSLRLEPLFKEFDVAKRRKETGDRIRRVAGKLGVSYEKELN
jgi:hypothetical protein